MMSYLKKKRTHIYYILNLTQGKNRHIINIFRGQGFYDFMSGEVSDVRVRMNLCTHYVHLISIIN